METHNNGNNETIATGIAANTDGTFTALTLTASKTFRTQAGAVRWLSRRGYQANGVRKPNRSMDQPAVAFDWRTKSYLVRYSVGFVHRFLVESLKAAIAADVADEMYLAGEAELEASNFRVGRKVDHFYAVYAVALLLNQSGK